MADHDDLYGGLPAPTPIELTSLRPVTPSTVDDVFASSGTMHVSRETPSLAAAPSTAPFVAATIDLPDDAAGGGAKAAGTVSGVRLEQGWSGAKKNRLQFRALMLRTLAHEVRLERVGPAVWMDALNLTPALACSPVLPPRSRQRRNWTTTACCAIACPALMVFICGILAIIVTALLANLVQPEAYRYCANVTGGLDPITNLPTATPVKDASGRTLLAFSDQGPCLLVFDHNYPSSVPYAPASSPNTSCSPGYIAETCPLADTYVGRPGRGHVVCRRGGD